MISGRLSLGDYRIRLCDWRRGSAGCTLATRLSEVPSVNECLVKVGIWSSDVARAMRMADRIEAGKVYINNFFSAATQSAVSGFKRSGYGRENGFEGMSCLMQAKSVWLATNPSQPDPFPED